MENITIIKIVAQCAAGAQINDCRREAIQLAMKHGKAVEFEHNSYTYRVNPDALLSTVQPVKGNFQPMG